MAYNVTVTSNVARIMAEARLRVTRAVTETAIDIERTAKELAPVKTGHLRRSIRYEVENQADVISGVVIAEADYSIFQELGTRYMPGKFFMQRALEANFKKGQERIAAAL